MPLLNHDALTFTATIALVGYYVSRLMDEELSLVEFVLLAALFFALGFWHASSAATTAHQVSPSPERSCVGAR
jgi:hypothetical protein